MTFFIHPFPTALVSLTETLRWRWLIIAQMRGKRRQQVPSEEDTINRRQQQSDGKNESKVMTSIGEDQVDLAQTYTGLDKKISEEFISIAMDPDRKSKASSHHGSEFGAPGQSSSPWPSRGLVWWTWPVARSSGNFGNRQSCPRDGAGRFNSRKCPIGIAFWDACGLTAFTIRVTSFRAFLVSRSLQIIQ